MQPDFDPSTSPPYLALAITRRDLIQAALTLAAASALLGFGSSATTSPAPPSTTSSQPIPSGPMTAASLTVMATAAGSIGPDFA